MTTVDAGLSVRLWRDHDPAVRVLPGMDMGTQTVRSGIRDQVAAMYRDGVRCAALDTTVDFSGGLRPAALVQAMIVVRELTSWGIVVDWRADLGTHHELWRRLNHLYPPAALVGHPEQDRVLAEWRDYFYLCKCIHRQGPGFVQVRDRRPGELIRFTIDDPEYLAAIDLLLDGVTVDAVPAHVLDDYVNEGLAGVVGTFAWWLPYRVQRWPWPALVV